MQNKGTALRLYDGIMELVESLVLNKVKTFTASFRKRTTAFAQFVANRFQLGQLLPVSRDVEYKGKKWKSSFTMDMP